MAATGWPEIGDVQFPTNRSTCPCPSCTQYRELDTQAQQRAHVLLLERLGPADATLFKAGGTIMRPSTLWPGLYYLLRAGRRVFLIDRGRLAAELCVEAASGEPEADRLMTILDWIEADERRLWQMANITGSWVPGYGPRVEERDNTTTAPTPPLPMRPVPRWPGVVLMVVGFGTAALIIVGEWLGYLT